MWMNMHYCINIGMCVHGCTMHIISQSPFSFVPPAPWSCWSSVLSFVLLSSVYSWACSSHVPGHKAAGTAIDKRNSLWIWPADITYTGFSPVSFIIKGFIVYTNLQQFDFSPVRIANWTVLLQHVAVLGQCLYCAKDVSPAVGGICAFVWMFLFPCVKEH